MTLRANEAEQSVLFLPPAANEAADRTDAAPVCCNREEHALLSHSLSGDKQPGCGPCWASASTTYLYVE